MESPVQTIAKMFCMFQVLLRFCCLWPLWVAGISVCSHCYRSLVSSRSAPLLTPRFRSHVMFPLESYIATLHDLHDSGRLTLIRSNRTCSGKGISVSCPWLVYARLSITCSPKKRWPHSVFDRRDNASVNVSAEVMAWSDKHQSRSETLNPHEWTLAKWQCWMDASNPVLDC